jgi:hypothetical protein
MSTRISNKGVRRVSTTESDSIVEQVRADASLADAAYKYGKVVEHVAQGHNPEGYGWPSYAGARATLLAVARECEAPEVAA